MTVIEKNSNNVPIVSLQGILSHIEQSPESQLLYMMTLQRQLCNQSKIL